MTPELAAAALPSELPYLPGVATPSEVMTARDLGISFLKLFPAEPIGGLTLLRALAPLLPGVAFCPSGGIDERSAAKYLALSNVPMVGRSWMAPSEGAAAGDWATVRRLAELRRRYRRAARCLTLALRFTLGFSATRPSSSSRRKAGTHFSYGHRLSPV
jgi:Entner-Doudoroff aldolase